MLTRNPQPEELEEIIINIFRDRIDSKNPGFPSMRIENINEKWPKIRFTRSGMEDALQRMIMEGILRKSGPKTFQYLRWS